jgi:hypothetical protein
LQASLIGNNADGNANVQASLIVNLANGDVNGWQGTVGVNICNGSLSGAQTAVGFNRTDKNVDGAQACVLWNWAGGDGRIETNYFNSKKNDQRTTWHMNGWQGAVLGNSAFGHVDGALTSVLYNMINGVNGEYGVNDGFEFGIINYLGGSESKHLPIIRFFTDDRTAAQKARAKAQVEYDKAIKEYEEKWRKYDDYGWRSHNCKRPIRPDPNDYFGDKTNPTMP